MKVNIPVWEQVQYIFVESAKSRAWRALVFGVLTSFYVCVFCMLFWSRALHVFVPATMKCFIFLHVCVLGVLSIDVLMFLVFV